MQKSHEYSAKVPLYRRQGNGLGQLRHWGGANYTGEQNYVHEQAVSDGRIVTANGSAAFEFGRELILLLENDPAEAIKMYCQFNRPDYADYVSLAGVCFIVSAGRNKESTGCRSRMRFAMQFLR